MENDIKIVFDKETDIKIDKFAFKQIILYYICTIINSKQLSF